MSHPPSAPLPAPGAPGRIPREYGLDWLRVFAFALLILYHSGMAFVPWDWHLKNPEHSGVLAFFMTLVNRWRLPLLFFISGAGVAFSLRRRTWGAFAKERLARLLLPLAVGIFVIVPPQIFLERRAGGATFSYLEFYRTVFDFVPYPKGSFSWHHLWFVAYILVYSLAGIPFFAALRGARGQAFLAAMVSAFTNRRLLIYAVGLPNLLVGVTLGPHWPTTHNLIADWANLLGSFLTFTWGYVVAVSPGFLDLVTRRRREFALGGLAWAALHFISSATGLTVGWPPTARLWYWNVINDYYGMTWIFALVGYARAHVTQPGPWLPRATEVVYPFYILHQTITVGLVYLAIPWPLGVWPKFIAVALGTFVGTALLVEFIRRTLLLRPLFGLRRTQPR